MNNATETQLYSSGNRIPLFGIVLGLLFTILISSCSKLPDAGGTESSDEKKEPANSNGDEVAVTMVDPSFDPEVPEEATEEEVIEKKPGAVSQDLKGDEMGIAKDILKMPSGPIKRLAMAALVQKWIKRDPKAALAYARGLGGNREMKRAFFQGAGPYLSKNDPYRLLKIIDAENWWPDQWLDEREALRRVSRSDFDRARQFYADTGDRKQHKEEAYQYTRRIANEQSVEEAFTFLNELENPIAIAWGTRAAVRSWMEADTNGAIAYVNNLEDPQQRDHAALGVIDNIWNSNPEESLIWAASIENNGVRQAAYVNLARSWQKGDQSANVTSLLSSPDLSAAERTAINAAIEQLAGTN